jgi:two-component system, OmpR family, sensor histidine kinase BaeS
MTMGIRAKLTVSYALLALLLVAALSLCINILFNAQFTGYVVNQQKEKVQSIVGLVQNQYTENSSRWNKTAVEDVGMSALGQGMILKVKDRTGKTVWDATVHNNGICAEMLRQMAANMLRQYPNFKGGYTQKSYRLMAGFKQVGTADVGYYGPFYYTANDLDFLNRVNAVLAAVGVAALLLALLLGGIMSARISKPLSRVTFAAAEISKGRYSQRIEREAGTREIAQLTATVNELARSLELQETLRRQMSADVAHELRTPLASLQSALEAMIDGVWVPSAERLSACHAEMLRQMAGLSATLKSSRAPKQTTRCSILRGLIFLPSRGRLSAALNRIFLKKGLRSVSWVRPVSFGQTGTKSASCSST